MAECQAETQSAGLAHDFGCKRLQCSDADGAAHVFRAGFWVVDRSCVDFETAKTRLACVVVDPLSEDLQRLLQLRRACQGDVRQERWVQLLDNLCVECAANLKGNAAKLTGVQCKSRHRCGVELCILCVRNDDAAGNVEHDVTDVGRDDSREARLERAWGSEQGVDEQGLLCAVHKNSAIRADRFTFVCEWLRAVRLCRNLHVFPPFVFCLRAELKQSVHAVEAQTKVHLCVHRGRRSAVNWLAEMSDINLHDDSDEEEDVLGIGVDSDETAVVHEQAAASWCAFAGAPRKYPLAGGVLELAELCVAPLVLANIVAAATLLLIKWAFVGVSCVAQAWLFVCLSVALSHEDEQLCDECASRPRARWENARSARQVAVVRLAWITAYGLFAFLLFVMLASRVPVPVSVALTALFVSAREAVVNQRIRRVAPRRLVCLVVFAFVNVCVFAALLLVWKAVLASRVPVAVFLILLAPLVTLVREKLTGCRHVQTPFSAMMQTTASATVVSVLSLASHDLSACMSLVLLRSVVAAVTARNRVSLLCAAASGFFAQALISAAAADCASSVARFSPASGLAIPFRLALATLFPLIVLVARATLEDGDAGDVNSQPLHAGDFFKLLVSVCAAGANCAALLWFEV